MMSTITRTGSDMVVGRLERYERGRQSVTRLMKLNHATGASGSPSPTCR